MVTNYYIIDYSTNFHLPYFNYQNAYEMVKLGKSFPNGLVKELYQKNIEGDIVMRRILVSYKTIDVKLIIPKECEYLITPIKINKR